MPFASFVVAGHRTAPLKSTKPVHNVIVNVIVLLSFLFACSSTKMALSTTCAAYESKRKTFWSQGHLQVSENKRIHVNGCPRMGVIVFFPLIVCPTKTHSLHICGPPRHNSLARGYYTIPSDVVTSLPGFSLLLLAHVPEVPGLPAYVSLVYTGICNMKLP